MIYPPLGALADSVGGLAGARLLSLVFMLGATALLWAAAGRLYRAEGGVFRRGAVRRAGPVLHLGAFATYDALSVLLVALAAWCVIRAGDRGEGTGWMAAAGATLALANAVAYSSALFDVIVLVLAMLAAWPARAQARRPARRHPADRGGGPGHRGAADRREGLPDRGGADHAGAGGRGLTPWRRYWPPWSWTGLIVLAGHRRCDHQLGRTPRVGPTLLLAVLALAGLLGPVEQARLHTLASLNKHVGLGAWFAAIAAGYAIDRFIAAAPAGRPRR